MAVGILAGAVSFSGADASTVPAPIVTGSCFSSAGSIDFLTSLLDLNVCGTKESLSIASISFTRFTCSTRVAWSSSFLFFASSSLLSLAFNASSALAAASRTSCNLALACSAGVRCSNPALMFPGSPCFAPHISFSFPLPFSFTFSFSLPLRRSLSRDPL